MPEIKTIRKLTTEETDVLRTLMYFDIFSYPVTLEEVFHCSSLPDTTLPQIHQTVRKLAAKKWLYINERYIALSDNPELIQRRIEGNHLARLKMERAMQISGFIGNFPFVRSVYLSGSISKGFMTRDADVDYFIITKPGRLWVARTMLVLFKKIFLLNSHKYFCVNYFIDTDHLEIEEKNIFTATELSFLVPSYGKEYYSELMQANEWKNQFMPVFPLRNVDRIPVNKPVMLKTILEKLLSGKSGEILDHFFMRKTIRRWHKKFGYMTEKELDIALKSRKYVSKHHPQNFQKKVLNALEERVRSFEEQHQVSFT